VRVKTRPDRRFLTTLFQYITETWYEAEFDGYFTAPRVARFYFDLFYSCDEIRMVDMTTIEGQSIAKINRISKTIGHWSQAKRVEGNWSLEGNQFCGALRQTPPVGG
jgi:hypothetical protein